jgi:hypothetical protein
MRSLVIFLLGFILRVAIIVTNPIIFGGDTMIRLADRYTLVKAHQLPMLQILIAAVSTISMDPVLVRYLMAVIGAVAGLGFYWMVTDVCGEKWAFPAALFFVTNPFVLAVSTVPFQEILMLAALFFAFHFFYNERWAAASLCLAVACLTRYEAWPACLVLAAAYVIRKDRSAIGWLKAAVLFFWMPAVWIALQHGLTSTGHFVIERSVSIWRLQRYVYLGWITVKYMQITVLLLAAAGVWRLYKDRSLLDWHMLMQVAFVVLFGISILFSAHGVMPDPERYVTSREAHIPIYFVVLLAALGLPALERPAFKGWMRPIVAASVVLGIAGAVWYVRVETSKPDIQLAYHVARFLDASVRDHERVLILAAPITEETSRLYLDKVRETGGEEGLRQARLELQQASAEPPEYQRVRVYSKLGRDRLLLPPATCADWAAVWSDYPDASRELNGSQPVQVLRAGEMSVTIVRRECGR